MDNYSAPLNRFFRIFVLVFLGLLGGGFLFLNNKINSLSQTSQIGSLENADSSKYATLDEVTDLIAKSLPESTSIPVSTSTPKTTSESRVVYIPLGGEASTQSTDWVDVKNAEVWLDFHGEYGQKAKASWDAFLKVENSNGTAYARLFDVNHGIAVNGSEITVANTDKFTQVSSGNLSLWNGRNLYRVQIKSLNSFPIYLDSARMKINY